MRVVTCFVSRINRLLIELRKKNPEKIKEKQRNEVNKTEKVLGEQSNTNKKQRK